MSTHGTGHLFGALVLFGLGIFFAVLSIRGFITGRLLGRNGAYVQRDAGPMVFTIALICYVGLSLFGFFGAIKILVMTHAQ